MRTSVYIDGFNFYYAAVKDTPYKWLDLKATFATLLQPQHRITAIKYFTAQVSGRRDPQQPLRQQTYWRALAATTPELQRELDMIASTGEQVSVGLLAIALLRTRHLAQTDADQNADQILTPEEFKLAQILDNKYLMPIDRTLCKKDSVLWLILLLGRMGGHQGMKHHGLPGWQSIWAGWKYFQNLTGLTAVFTGDNDNGISFFYL